MTSDEVLKVLRTHPLNHIRYTQHADHIVYELVDYSRTNGRIVYLFSDTIAELLASGSIVRKHGSNMLVLST